MYGQTTLKYPKEGLPSMNSVHTVQEEKTFSRGNFHHYGNLMAVNTCLICVKLFAVYTQKRYAHLISVWTAHVVPALPKIKLTSCLKSWVSKEELHWREIEIGLDPTNSFGALFSVVRFYRSKIKQLVALSNLLFRQPDFSPVQCSLARAVFDWRSDEPPPKNTFCPSKTKLL